MATLYHKGSPRPDGQGRLILAGTPIGNLSDASFRLKRVLAEADIIAAEDTRVARSLLHKLEVKGRARLVSLHEHNERDKAAGLVDRIEAGDSVVLVSDAGMPAISDPGYRLVALAHERNLAVTSVPGPSAVTAALAMSGLPSDRFAFEGFVRSKPTQKMRQFEQLRDEPRTLVFFESPRRLAESLQFMAKCFGSDRQVAVVREITKMFEEVVRDTLENLVTWAETVAPKGEIVLVVQGAKSASADVTEELLHEVQQLRARNIKHKEATRVVAEKYGVSRRELYERTLNRRRD